MLCGCGVPQPRRWGLLCVTCNPTDVTCQSFVGQASKRFVHTRNFRREKGEERVGGWLGETRLSSGERERERERERGYASYISTTISVVISWFFQVDELTLTATLGLPQFVQTKTAGIAAFSCFMVMLYHQHSTASVHTGHFCPSLGLTESITASHLQPKLC